MFIFCTGAHMHCCLSIKWVDQGVVYPFDYLAYSVIRPASGTKVSGSTVKLDPDYPPLTVYTVVVI